MNSYVGIWIGWSKSQPPPEMYKYMHWHWNNNQSGVITYQWYQSLAISHNSCLLYFSPGILLPSPLPDCLLHQSAICMCFSLRACVHSFVCVILFSFASFSILLSSLLITFPPRWVFLVLWFCWESSTIHETLIPRAFCIIVQWVYHTHNTHNITSDSNCKNMSKR